jgi:hypothetical protein
MVLGMSNTTILVFDFIGWIDKCDGLEKLPESLLSARANFTEAVSYYVQDFKEEHTVWVQLVDPQLSQQDQTKTISLLSQKNDHLRGRTKCSTGAESCGDQADQGISSREKGN